VLHVLKPARHSFRFSYFWNQIGMGTDKNTLRVVLKTLFTPQK
jgi:hypothetical protein